jgi:hypothetical protein
MIFSFTMPVITLREAEKADASRIEGGTWEPDDDWGITDARILRVNDKRVDYVLVLGGADSNAVIPVFEYINPSDKQRAVQTAQTYLEVLLAESLTRAAIESLT